MKLKILVCCLIFLLPLSLYAKAPAGKAPTDKVSAIDTESWIDVNKLLMFFTNEGSFAHQAANTFGKSDGLFFPYSSIGDIESGANDNTVIFAAGPWMGAIDRATGDTLTVIAEFSFEYWPGPMLGDTFDPEGETNPNFRVFTLYKDSLGTNPGGDYFDYMTYGPDQGAPFWDADYFRYDTTFITPIDFVVDTVQVGFEGEPKILGDQFLWSVFNDANPDAKTNSSSATEPLGVEIKASCFGFNREDALGNMVFLRYRIFNKGGKDLDDVFISLWADPDLGGAADDLVGCDTTLDMGYCYNATNNDSDYGSTPPAVGFDFFQGPLVATGDPADTALMWDFQKYEGFTNMGMTSFNKYINGTDPQNYVWTYQYMNGLDASLNGAPLPNGTKFYGPGDPVTGTGDLDAAPDDRRWMQTTGPITLEAGDSTEILAAVVVGRGINRLSSISAMKFFDVTAQLAYDDEFILPEPPAAPAITIHQLEGRVSLEWTDTSEVDEGDYTFEGYTVFQGPAPSGPWTRLANYDLNNGLQTIADTVFDEDLGIVFLPVKFGLDEGLARHFSTTQDAINGGSLANNTDYYFRVEAYSFKSDGKPRTLTSATNVRVTPQTPVADLDYATDYGEILEPVHSAGVSGAIIEAIVLGPDSLTGDDYEITFRDTLGIVVDTFINTDVAPPETTLTSTDIAWFLENTTTGEMLLEWQTNFSGDEDYQVIDGILLKVIQPAAGFANFSVVANADGVVDPPEPGALWFGDFPVPTINDPDGYITEAQQVYSPGGQWGFHTIDNGGTCAGGERGDLEAFVERTLRNEFCIANTGINDFEMRFTGTNDDPGTGGSYAIEWYNDDNVFWVPFELWRIGVSTPDDPSDDVRLVPFIIDDAGEYGVWPGNDIYDLESYGCIDDETGAGDGEHSVSGGDNDPTTDWVYWYVPADETPGEAGYDANEAQMLAGTYDATLLKDAPLGEYNNAEVFARTVLVSWNGGIEPPFAQDLPEMGTIFRIETGKPITNIDVFQYTAPARTTSTAGGEDRLQAIRAVPNPYYLASSYDNSVTERRMRFTNLPSDATIKIYNLTGDLVATVDREQPEYSWEDWNVETSFGIPVASGIYIYVVDSPLLGTKIGKMAIFIEEEQLGTF